MTTEACLGKKIGIFLMVVSFVCLPIHSSLSFAADAPVKGPSTERGTGETAPKPVETPYPTNPETDQDARGGDAGAGVSKDVKSKKWWWIGGGVAAVVAVIAAAAGGGGGGGGGSSATH